jgi:hypothetical protein
MSLVVGAALICPGESISMKLRIKIARRNLKSFIIFPKEWDMANIMM